MMYFNLIYVFIKNSVQEELEYRFDFFMNFFNAVISLLASLAVIYVMFQNANEIGGWTFTEVVVLIGVFRLVRGIVDSIIIPNLGQLSEYVRQGTMDFILLKPINAQFYVSLRRCRIWDASNILIGFFLIFVGLYKLKLFSLVSIILGSLLIVLSIIIIYSIWFIIMSLAFWFVDVRNLQTILNMLMEFGQFPLSVYPSGLRFLFSFIFPIAFITTIPASAFIGNFSIQLLGLAGLITLIFFINSVVIWRMALRSYSSASS